MLKVEYPEGYPDEAPLLELSVPAGAPPHKHFNIETDRERLLASLSEAVEENMGMAMVFTLVSTLKEAAEQIVAERQEHDKQEHVKRVLALEAEENKKFHGIPVTPENFLKWRAEFRQEMAEKERAAVEAEEAADKKRNKGREPEIKLTGKQLWERGIATKTDDLEFEDEPPVAGMQNVKV